MGRSSTVTRPGYPLLAALAMASRRLLGTALLAAACLSFPSAATAVTMQTFDFSGQPILGGDDPSFRPDVTVKFSFDETCMTSSCNLTVALTYNDSGGLSTIGEALAGVSFDASSNGSPIDLAVSLSSSTMSADSLVGAGSVDALNDFGGANSNVDVSRHWAFVSGFASSGSLGSNVLSSVGDAFPDTDVVGMADLFTSGILSGVEPNPPDGTSFSIVDDNTCTPGTCGGLGGGFQDSNNRTWIQNEATGTLVYDGTTNKLTSVSNVDPLFGTEGLVLVPEPGSVMLLGLGVAGLVILRRRQSKS